MLTFAQYIVARNLLEADQEATVDIMYKFPLSKKNGLTFISDKFRETELFKTTSKRFNENYKMLVALNEKYKLQYPQEFDAELDQRVTLALAETTKC